MKTFKAEINKIILALTSVGIVILLMFFLQVCPQIISVTEPCPGSQLVIMEPT